MALIKYVGKKQRKTDTVAGSGVVWNGPGDVQQVADKFVAELLKHTDSWILADGEAAPVVAAELGHVRPADIEESADKPPLVNLDSMSKQELRDYAQRYLGETLHHNLSEEKMRQRIVGLMNRG